MDRSDPSFAVAGAELIATTALANWMIKATPYPALVIDENARILYANVWARQVLNSGDGLEDRFGILRCQREDDQSRFNRLLNHSNNTAHAESPVVLRLERPSGKRGFGLTFLRTDETDTAVPMWIVLISDTSERLSLRPQWIEAMFDVTRGEARVLALVSEGMSAEDIGNTLQIATATVRVHLRNVYRKLKVNRQSDLVATILKAIMPMCACEAARHAVAGTPVRVSSSAHVAA